MIASHGWEEAMTAKKTRLEREKELQTLLGSLAGKAELEALADRYAASSPRIRPAGCRSSPTSWSASASGT